jgi:predicted dehydrogenase
MGMTVHIPVQVAIIGLGGVGERIFHTCMKNSLTKIAVICDLAEEKVKQLGERHDLKWCTDYRQILEDPNIDLVYVGVPPKYHHKIVMDVLNAQKHILCEKPLANSLAESQEMFEFADKSAMVHAMHFPTYYRAAFYEMSQKVKDGFLGRVKRIEVKTHFRQWPREWQQNNWIGGREQGGFIREVLPHYIQLIRALFGPIQNIRSSVQYPTDPGLCEAGIWATAQLKNEVPVIFEGTSQISQKDEVSFTLYGSHGTLSLEDWNVLKAGVTNDSMTIVSLEDNNRTLDMLNQVIKAILGEQADVIDFKEGYEIQKVLETLLNA